MFIANATKQPHEFSFRLPGEDMASFKRVSVRTLPPGGQDVVAEGPLTVLEGIIEQYRIYGIVPLDEAVKTRGFIGYIFSIDEPIDVERLGYAADHNQGVLWERGLRQRQEMAIGIDHALEDGIRAPVRTFELEIAEDAEKPTMAEGLRVVRDNDVARAGGIRSGRG